MSHDNQPSIHLLRTTCLVESAILPPLVSLLLALGLCGMDQVAAQDRLFSGPQVGEKLPAFKVRGVFGTDPGSDLDFVSNAAGKPLVLIFVHDVTRPSLRLTKLLTYYTTGLGSERIATGVVWLTDDVSGGEAKVKMLGHNVPPGERGLSRSTPTGVSLDGVEGPGSYGLNRNVTLTICVANAGRTTANFALIQPSITVDLPKILHEIEKVTGDPAPSLDDLLCVSGNAFFDSVLSLLDRAATPLEVDQAALSIERGLKKDKDAGEELGRVLRHVVDKGLLDKHGTPRAREHLRKWHGEPSLRSPPVGQVGSAKQ